MQLNFKEFVENRQEESAVLCTLTGTFICQQLEAFSAVALKAADGVPAEVIATAVVKLALINICGKQVIS